MGQLRRFVLVATAVAGFLCWLGMPLHWRNDLAFVGAGLAAAVASAAVSWSPRLGRHAIGRVALAGWLSFGLLEFSVLAWRDASGFGLGGGSAIGVFVIAWLVLTGVIGQLVIASVRPREIYFGMGLAFSAIVPFLHRSPKSSIGSTIGGMWMLGLGTMFCAWVTAKVQQRFAREAAPELPDARALAKNVE